MKDDFRNEYTDDENKAEYLLKKPVLIHKQKYITGNKIAYKYGESQIIDDIKTYIDSTYTGHYTTDTDIQALDAWIALGDATSSFRDTAIKYLWRYGKKNGNNKQDLMKVLHYTMLMLYNDHYKTLKE
jgi:hypothetical protein